MVDPSKEGLCLWDPVNPAHIRSMLYGVNERSSNGCTPFLRHPIRRDLPNPTPESCGLPLLDHLT